MLNQSCSKFIHQIIKSRRSFLRKQWHLQNQSWQRLTVTNTEVVWQLYRWFYNVGFVAYTEEPVEKEFNGTSCAPNDKFKIDCNTCYCNSDGSGYSCTEISCAERITTAVKVYSLHNIIRASCIIFTPERACN